MDRTPKTTAQACAGHDSRDADCESAMAGFTNLMQLEEMAKKKLSKMAFDYFESGSDDGVSKHGNIAAWKRLRLVPRVLVDVSSVDTSCQFLGQKISFPVLIPPMAMQCLAQEVGEVGMAQAAARTGIPMILSTMATCSISEVAAANPAPMLLFQLYVTRTRAISQSMIEEAEHRGYRAIVVTVDVPRLGNREDDARNRFELPKNLSLKNWENRLRDPLLMRHQTFSKGSKLNDTFKEQIDPSLTWEIISWLRSITKLPIFIKGLLSPDDAVIAVQNNVDGIIVSNHGGRQLDTTIAPADALPAVVHAVAGRIPVLVDGGIRRGTDIVKALALGASAVLVGRPFLYGLAVDGQSGAKHVIESLKEEFQLAMALCGCPSISTITSRLLTQSML